VSAERVPVKWVIFDLDGTLYRGKTAIPGAAASVNHLRQHVSCRFLSNNGERQAQDLEERLRGLGFRIEAGDVASSADLVLEYVGEHHPSSRVLALTSEHLAHALEARGCTLVEDESAELIVVGVDRRLSRPRLTPALRAALNGATIIGTNEDPTFPGECGMKPAAGAFVGIFRGMGFEPHRLCGKPSEWAVREALKRWEIDDPTACLFVGDNLRTDIAAAVVVGARSALVRSGVSNEAELTESEAKPTLVIDSVADLSPDCLEELAEVPLPAAPHVRARPIRQEAQCG